jgi:hypothetical protein
MDISNVNVNVIKKKKQKKRKPQPILEIKRGGGKTGGEGEDGGVLKKQRRDVSANLPPPPSLNLPAINGMSPALVRALATKGDKKKTNKRNSKNQKNTPATSSSSSSSLKLIQEDDIDEYDDDEYPVVIDLKELMTDREMPSSSSSSSITDGHSIATDSDLTSFERAQEFFSWLIAPLTIEEFQTHYWERKPLIIKRHNPSFYSGWFSKVYFLFFFFLSSLLSFSSSLASSCRLVSSGPSPVLSSSLTSSCTLLSHPLVSSPVFSSSASSTSLPSPPLSD